MNYISNIERPSSARKILIVDDELEMLQVLKRYLTRKGFTVHTAESGKQAAQAIEETMFDLVISDLAMDDIDGMELLKIVRATDENMPFVMMTGVGNIENAVEAIKLGAFHYFTKPFKLQEVENIVKRGIEHGIMNRKLVTYKLQNDSESDGSIIYGSSKRMQDLFRQVEKISNSEATVLLQGETGTGKSLMAKIIHDNSERRDRLFLTIDCGALADTLLESELFGHVKGAFTGAVAAKRGLLEEAEGGTIFLDEISEIKLPTQVKLLRVIQEKEIKAVGGNRSIRINVRFISATSLDLEKSVKEGLFREELYYRLAVIPLHIPPLRERKEDIPLLVDHFLTRFCKQYKRKISSIEPQALKSVYNYDWKGNIRELANVLERAVLLAEKDTIRNICLTNNSYGSQTGHSMGDLCNLSLKQVVEETEKRAIVDSLKLTNNNRTQAARLLSISRRSLYDKIEAYGIK